MAIGEDAPQAAVKPHSDKPPTVNTRDLSYAASAKTGLGRAVVRVTENLTGRLQVLYRLWGYQEEVAAGASLWDVAWRRYGLTLEALGEGVDGVPESGPLLVVANHPFGILDGLTLGHILKRRRADFKIVANSVFTAAPELAPYIAPISFDQTKAALAANLATRRAAAAYVNDGGCVALFPGGQVSSSARMFGPSFDPDWRPFTAKLIRETKATIVPLFFIGRNGWLFHASGHVAPAVRYGLHIREFKRRVGGVSRVVVGAPISREAILAAGDPAEQMTYLRKAVYGLSPEPLGPLEIGRRYG